MTAAAAKKKAKPNKARHIYARVQHDGALVCEDNASRSMMRRMRITRGQLVRIEVTKPRDYGQWKKAHNLGTLLAQSLDDFAEFALENGKYDSHGALKKLQRLSGVLCEQSEIEIPGIGKLSVSVPQSLAFDELDETEFQVAYAGFAAYIVKTYWHDLDQSDVEHMAALCGMSNT